MRPRSLPLAVVCLILVLSCSAAAFAFPIVAADNYTTTKNTPLNVPAPGVLGNDYDDNGRGLTASLGT
ncbi:MAG: hypothetical protein ABFE07_21780, partial [Armatimonadia bacterium]